MANEKQVCTGCGEPKALSEFYASSSPFHKFFGKLSICKECFWNYIGVDNEEFDLNKLVDALRMIDKPFIMDLLEPTLQEAERDNKAIGKIYMKNIAMPQYKGLTWNDSQFDGFKKQPDNILREHKEFDDEDFTINDEMRRYWGRNLEDWEIDYLESERVKLMTSFECPDYGMEMIMKEICYINLEILTLRQNRENSSKDQKTITNLIDTRSKLMNDANMKPIQSTGAEASDQVTFGTLIKKWENERPVPKPLDDEMKEYIDTYMIGHLAKMEGLHNEMTEKYEKELSKYTIDLNEVNKDEEDFEE